MIDDTKKPGRENRAGFDTDVDKTEMNFRGDSVRPWAVRPRPRAVMAAMAAMAAMVTEELIRCCYSNSFYRCPMF